MRVKFFTLLVALFLVFFTVGGMTTFVIQNKMDRDIYVDGFKTNGTVVYNQSSLCNEPLSKGRSIRVEVGVDSADCDSKDNYVLLEIFNKSTQEYADVSINWDVNGVKADHYVVKDFYRVVQQFNGRSVILTFYEDVPSVVDQLKTMALSKMKRNATAVQQISEENIARYCGGISVDELKKSTQGNIDV